MKLAFKYRFYPTSEQARVLAQTFGCVRYVYNFGLDLRSTAYNEQGESLSYKDTSAALTELKKQEETAWLRDVSCVPLQQALRHLNTAFVGFFGKRTDYPTFKSRHRRQSAEYTRSAFRYADNSTKSANESNGTPVLQLAKMRQPLKVRWSRRPPSEPSTVTVSRDAAGRYFVSLLCEVEPKPLPPTRTADGSDKAVGVDLGLTDVCVTSDGFKSGNPRHLERDLAKLRRAQKSLSRKEKGSNNYQKRRRRVAKIHARIKDRRQDFLHKLTTKLIRENQTVCLETLNVSGMLKNHRLSRHIAGASWHELVRQLEYKAALYGRDLVRVDQWFPSSKRCSNCKHQVKELPLSVRQWTCERCGTSHDRDVNAALNICAEGQRLGAGLALSASGEDVRPGSVSAETGCLSEGRILAL